MKIGTIGTSWICEAFISAAKHVGGYEFKAAYSRTQEKAEAYAKKHGFEKCYTNLTEMAKSDIDAVYIASPNSFHYEQTKLFLENGKSVICEKPATTTKEQELELLELSDKKGLIYTEAIKSLYVPAFDILKNEVAKLGQIRTVNFVFCQLSSKYSAYLRNECPNIFNPKMHTGCLMDIGVYNIYLAAALFGMPEKIISNSIFLNTGADASGISLLCYKDMTVNLIYSKVGQNYSPSEIIGDRGTISINSLSQLVGIDLIKDGKRENLIPYNMPQHEIMGAEAASFRDAVLYGKNEKTEFVKTTSLLVREITDEIKKQNCFLF
ncbi:MAG: Gfo/Idh/MocA family oxidoreductase [Oscillospiraceae bacterium]|nr:Gfo/Idh/MocA family oxidoreductase [Oscillospiraceae bacterium]